MKSKTRYLPLIAIVGPTASGKTSIAIDLAKRIDGEIICADSRTIYRGMDIGTAKPTIAEQSKVKHWCLDLVLPGQQFSVFQFQQLANELINDIKKRDKIPIIVGGTGLYIDSILYQYEFRNRSQKNYGDLSELSVTELQNICKKNNFSLPKNFKNKRHLIGTITAGGDVVKNIKQRQDSIVVGITTNKEVLSKKIRSRIEQMLSDGLLEETQQLIDRYGSDNQAFTANIYSIIIDHLKQKINQTELIDLAVRKDLRLVKKQITWFKRNPSIKWLPIEKINSYIDARMAEL